MVHPDMRQQTENLGMIPPSVASTDRFYTIEIVREALWIWKDYNLNQETIKVLSSSLKPLGYKINDNEEK